jgi:dGTPase
MLRLRTFMFDRVYLGEHVRREHAKIETVLRTLFEHYAAGARELPPGVPGASEAERVTDYLAGMTDRYCIRAFEALTIPSELPAAGA